VFGVGVAHEPVEYVDVAVDTDVDVVQVLRVSQVLLKVLHALEEEPSLALEVFVYFLVLVAHVDHYLILGIGKGSSGASCLVLEVAVVDGSSA
jgi:VanZ family protein